MVKRINFKELRQELSFEAILTHYEVSLKGSHGQLSGFCPLPTIKGKVKASARRHFQPIR
jgi:hypothetical protein